MIEKLFKKQIEEAVEQKRAELESARERSRKVHQEYKDKLSELEKRESKLQEDINDLFEREDKLSKEKEELQLREQELAKRQEEMELPLYLDECGISSNESLFYRYDDSSEYKLAIENVNNQMKAMVGAKIACTSSMEWTVNGSKAKGRKQINDYIKMALRLFNAETDTYIMSINTRSNITNVIKRIKKSHELVNRFCITHAITLSQEYVNLKIELANLVYEQIMKKQEEKEEARRQAEIIREQEKLEREIDKEREKLAKEVKQYQTEIDRLYKTVDVETGEINEEVAARLEELENKISEIQEQDAALEERIHNKAGWVYIITNDHMGGCKIGVTRRMNAQDRIDELGSASVPFRFNTNCVVFSEDAFALENQLHKVFHSKRINKVNNRKEFFSVTTQEIEEYIKTNIDSTVKFLHDIHDSEYLLSL